MSILKNILKPFVEFNKQEDEPAGIESSLRKRKDQGNGINSTGETVSKTARNNVTTTFTPANTTNESALTEYHKYFENLIEEANAKNPMFQGTDFKEFIDSKIDVEAIADEGTRYKTAFNVLKRTGLTKEKLVTTGQQYMQLIDQDLKGFADAYNQQYKKRRGTKGTAFAKEGKRIADTQR